MISGGYFGVECKGDEKQGWHKGSTNYTTLERGWKNAPPYILPKRNGLKDVAVEFQFRRYYRCYNYFK